MVGKLRIQKLKLQVDVTVLGSELTQYRRQAVKADVRKLKTMGLTISHEVGYELSARGKAVLKRWKA